MESGKRFQTLFKAYEETKSSLKRRAAFIFKTAWSSFLHSSKRHIGANHQGERNICASLRKNEAGGETQMNQQRAVGIERRGSATLAQRKHTGLENIELSFPTRNYNELLTSSIFLKELMIKRREDESIHEKATYIQEKRQVYSTSSSPTSASGAAQRLS